MKKALGSFIILGLAFLNLKCGGGSSASPATPPPIDIGSSEPYALAANANNVVAVSLGSTCQVGSSAYQNEICVSVTVCNSSSTCTTVNNVLLDTGSYGLRLFKSAALTNLSLPSVSAGGGNVLYNCATYLDNSGDWGAVKSANLTLGGMSATNVPIEIITSGTDPGDGTPTGHCAAPGITLDSSASAAGFNGILGVGVFQYDCGTDCTTNPSKGIYFSCPSAGGTCSAATAALSKQVQNPVFLMGAGYNNGIVMNLPTVAGLGVASTSGQMIIGIGSVANNTPTTSSELTADGNGFFHTTYNGTNYSKGFIDSGSNGFYFPGNLTLCSDQEFWCPSSAQTLSAVMLGLNSYSRTVSFQIANTDTLLNANGGNNRVFYNFGGSEASPYFDWGLPVFMGRRIYVGYDGASATFMQNGASTTWTGPYWAL